MENQEGFERLVPYRTEKELKEATKWYNTVDCKKIIDRETIEMILYNTSSFMLLPAPSCKPCRSWGCPLRCAGTGSRCSFWSCGEDLRG